MSPADAEASRSSPRCWTGGRARTRARPCRRTGFTWRASPTSSAYRSREYPGGVRNILLTNDDGIEADGLRSLRRALVQLDEVRVIVIAPDGNRSAMARSITTRRPLWVAEVEFSDGTTGYATDGTPVDCVRLANLGLIDGFEADLVVSGINHGANLGDDITYSGTVAAALEGLVLGIPGIAVSQQSGRAEGDWSGTGTYDFAFAADFVARLVESLRDSP